jgi:hypothetical protein
MNLESILTGTMKFQLQKKSLLLKPRVGYDDLFIKDHNHGHLQSPLADTNVISSQRQSITALTMTKSIPTSLSKHLATKKIKSSIVLALKNNGTGEHKVAHLTLDGPKD